MLEKKFLEKKLRCSCPECKGEKKIYGIYSAWDCLTCTSNPHLFDLGDEISEETAEQKVFQESIKKLDEFCYVSESVKTERKFFYNECCWLRAAFFDKTDELRIMTWFRFKQEWLDQKNLIDSYTGKVPQQESYSNKQYTYTSW